MSSLVTVTVSSWFMFQMIGLLQYVLRSGIETEASFTSVERLTSYMVSRP